MFYDDICEGSPDEELSRRAVRFFGYKREINIKKYKNIDIEETVYLLQKKYPEFCLLLYWHDNGLSKQQYKITKMYRPPDLMKAWWAVKYNIKGPCFPIHGYSSWQYEEIKKDNSQRVLRQMLDKVYYDYPNWELQWSEDITFKNGTYVMSYCSQYLKILDAIGYDDVSYWLWNRTDMAVREGIDWRHALMQQANIGKIGLAVSDSAYNMINKYYLKRHPNIWDQLCMEYEDFEIVFSNEPKQVKDIRITAIKDGRELTKIERDYIQSIIDPPKVSIKDLQDKIEHVKKMVKHGRHG